MSRLLTATTIGTVGVAVLILVVGMVIALEAHHPPTAALQTPSPVPDAPLTTPTPTPRLVYTPQVPGLKKDTATTLFLSVMGLRNPNEFPILQRWQLPQIPLALRGQPTAKDRQCFIATVHQLNGVMQSSQLQVSEVAENGISLYILPRTQFSSVDIDAPSSEPAYMTYRSFDDGRLANAELLVNTTQTDQERCWYIQRYLPLGLGILTTTELPMPNSFLSRNSTTVDDGYSPYDLEMVRILYSPFVTAGLTATEVERRLLQE